MSRRTKILVTVLAIVIVIVWVAVWLGSQGERLLREAVRVGGEALSVMGREGIEPSTLGLRVPCSTS